MTRKQACQRAIGALKPSAEAYARYMKKPPAARLQVLRSAGALRENGCGQLVLPE